MKAFGSSSLKNVSEILIGIMHLIKGDFEHVKPLFLKIGAFPENDQFDKLLKVLVKFKSLLKGRAELK